MKLGAKANDGQAKMQVQNQKSMQDREAHQAHMFEKSQDMELNRQKFDLQVGSHQMKQQDIATRASERQMAAQQKALNPTRGRPV